MCQRHVGCAYAPLAGLARSGAATPRNDLSIKLKLETRKLRLLLCTSKTNTENQTKTKMENRVTRKASSRSLSRRDFIAFSLAAGLTPATGAASGAEQPVIDIDVEVKTADGVCDAVFIHPGKGSHPGVLLWHDSPGLRPVMRDLGKRIAAEGYSVLVPNLFYRAHRAPVFEGSFDY